MQRKDRCEIRINPENRICPKFDRHSLATFPNVPDGNMGIVVMDDCAEEHIM